LPIYQKRRFRPGGEVYTYQQKNGGGIAAVASVQERGKKLREKGGREEEKLWISQVFADTPYLSEKTISCAWMTNLQDRCGKKRGHLSRDLDKVLSGLVLINGRERKKDCGA